MPKYSYWAAAYGHLASYIVMFAISSILGAKYYPIPYRWGRLLSIIALMGATYGISLLLDSSVFADISLPSAGTSAWPFIMKLGVHTLLILVYAAGAWRIIARRTVR